MTFTNLRDMKSTCTSLYVLHSFASLHLPLLPQPSTSQQSKILTTILCNIAENTLQQHKG